MVPRASEEGRLSLCWGVASIPAGGAGAGHPHVSDENFTLQQVQEQLRESPLPGTPPQGHANLCTYGCLIYSDAEFAYIK